MANQYFNYTSDFLPGESVASERVDELFEAIEDAFDKLANPGDLKVGANIGADDTGTANNYVVDNGGDPTLIDFQLTTFRPLNTNTGAAVLDVNSSGNTEIVRNDGTALQAGDLIAGVPTMVIYDNTEDRWVLVGSTSQQTKQEFRPSIINKTASFTLQASDEASIILASNASAITVTVPSDTDASIPTSFIVHIHQQGAGRITLSPGAGVTLNSAVSLTTRGQYSSLSISKVAANTYNVIGDMLA